MGWDVVGFHLERLSMQDLKKAAEIYEGGNLARLMNIAAEYYLELRKKGDRSLERFIKERIQE
jgi:hypothetical protein